ncbi:MAG TPA: hypothetical protein VM620_15075, partial [Hyphomicrobium sp.]|nr:hypothetical protein [Hyphomicrobium sp.]
NGRDMILFGFERHQLDSANLASHFEALGPINTATINKNGVEVGAFYYRLGQNYRALPTQ